MTRFLKEYLLWLLIAVLPLQGFAAVVLRSCSSGQMSLSSVVRATSMHDYSAHQMDTTSEPCVQMASHDGCTAHTSDSPKKSSGNHAFKHGSCSACASCCVGAAAPTALFSFRVPSKIPEVRRTSGVTPVIGFIPDSLERPPRQASI
jgi:hypothetical protein